MTLITTDQAHEVLQALVEIPSQSGDEETAAVYLRDVLRSAGREVYLDEVGNVRTPGSPDILLTSHIDTVGGTIPVRVESTPDGQYLWGRGSVDATGSLVAMAMVAISTGVSFAGVVGEEADSRGAQYLVDDRAEPRCVINGEPNGWDGIGLGYRGLIRGTFTVSEPRSHSSRPTPNAMETAASWTDAVTGAPGDPSKTITVTPASMTGGISDNGLATEARVEFTVRVPPSTSPTIVRQQLEETVDDGSIEWGDVIPPFVADPRSTPATALRGAIRTHGGEPKHVFKGGTCDANLYAANWSCPIVVYGPGDAALDHTPNERLSLEEFDRSIAVLETAVDALTEDIDA